MCLKRLLDFLEYVPIDTTQQPDAVSVDDESPLSTVTRQAKSTYEKPSVMEVVLCFLCSNAIVLKHTVGMCSGPCELDGNSRPSMPIIHPCDLPKHVTVLSWQHSTLFVLILNTIPIDTS